MGPEKQVKKKKTPAAAQPAAPVPCCLCLTAPRWRVSPVQSADAMGPKIACCFPDHLEGGGGGDGRCRGRPTPALVVLNWLGVRD